MFKDLEKTFSKKVENRVADTGETYMDAINHLCEEMQIEQELAAKYLSQPIIEKIKVEAQQVNLLPRDPQLFSEMG
jgi:gas vesicle protein